ncbi:uncharacterized protein LOC135500385 isoform X2 [Lineus longissimus]|uniref:uncharacterized protein LOC135500385 isoform X2 n=1 Tax=Lineus longissimus TaxID=88925 RepID=UPI00315D8A95
METTVFALVSLLFVISFGRSVPVSAVPPCKFDSLDELPKSILNTTLPRGISQNITLQACETGCTYVSSCIAVVFIPDEEDASQGKCIHHIRDWAKALYKSDIGKLGEDVLIERKKCQKIPVPAKGVPHGCKKIETMNLTTWLTGKRHFKAAGPPKTQSNIDGCKVQCQLNQKCDLFARLNSSRLCIFLHKTTVQFYHKSCNLQADTKTCKMTQKKNGLPIAMLLARKKIGVTVEQCKTQCMKDTRCATAECDIKNGANTCKLKASFVLFGRKCDVIKGESCQLTKIDKPLTNAVTFSSISIPGLANVNELYQFCNQRCTKYCTQVKIMLVDKRAVCQLYTQQKSLKKTCIGTTCSMAEVETLKAQIPKDSVYHQVNTRPVEFQGVNCSSLCLNSYQCIGVVIRPGPVPTKRRNKVQNVVMPLCQIHFRMEFKLKTCSNGKCVMLPLKNGTKITNAFENVWRTPTKCAELCLTLKYCTAIAFTKIISQCSIFGKSSLEFDDAYQKKCSHTGTCSMAKVPHLRLLYGLVALLKNPQLAKLILAQPVLVKPNALSKCIVGCRNNRQCSILFLKFSLEKNMIRCDFLMKAPYLFGEKKCRSTPWAAKPICTVKGPTRTVPFPMDSPNHSFNFMRTVTQESHCPKLCQQSTQCAAFMIWRLIMTNQQSATGQSGQRFPQGGHRGQRSPQNGYGGYRGPQGGYGGQPSPLGGYPRHYNPRAGYGSRNDRGQRRQHAPGQDGYAGQPNPYGAAPGRRRLLHYHGGYGTKPLQNGYNGYGHQMTGNRRRKPAGYGGYGRRREQYGGNGYGEQGAGYRRPPRRPAAYGRANSYQPRRNVFFLCAMVSAQPIKPVNRTGDPTETISTILTPHVSTRILQKNCTDAARKNCSFKMTQEFITKDMSDMIPNFKKYTLGYSLARKTPTSAMLEDCRKDPQCVSVLLFKARRKVAANFVYDPIVYPKNCAGSA